MLKLTYRQINDETTKAINEILSLDVPIKEGVKIAKVSKKIAEHIEIKRDFTKKILDKYSEKDETGTIKPVKDDEGNIKPNQVFITDAVGYTKDMTDLENLDIEITDFDKIEIDSLGLGKVKPQLLLNLDWLLNLDSMPSVS